MRIHSPAYSSSNEQERALPSLVLSYKIVNNSPHPPSLFPKLPSHIARQTIDSV